MVRKVVMGLLVALMAGGVGRAEVPATTSAATQGAGVDLMWNGKETVAAYAKRCGIKVVEQNLDLGKGMALKVTLVPAGKFKMGIGEEEAKLARTYMHNGAGDPSDEMPQHEVTISKPFYMGVTMVTQEQCLALVGTAQVKGDKGPKLPETVLDWEAANGFCKALGEKAKMTVRLPTEAEWEYACRAGTVTAFNTGATISVEQANYEGDQVWGTGTKGVYRGKMLPVGSFKANGWGLFDMHGNAPEWCADWYGADYYKNSPELDPTGPGAGGKRVVRGGSCHTPPRILRSGKRDAVPAGTVGIGMRVVVEVGGKDGQGDKVTR